MTLTELLQWWNLVFALPFVAALGYLVLLATGSVAAEHDAEIPGFDNDFDHGIEHSVEVHHGVHGHVEGDDDITGFGKALSILGVGKAPISVILMCFCFIWGFAGWVGNQIFQSILPEPVLFIWPSLGMALLCSVILTRGLAFGLARALPSTETYAVSNPQLVGKRAVVRFKVTDGSGTAQLYDDYGNLHEVSCRVKAGEQGLPQGTRVILMGYDDQKQVFLARVDPLEEHGLDHSPARGMLK